MSREDEDVTVKQPQKFITAWLSVFAVSISIISAIYNAYDFFVFSSEREKIQLIAEIRQGVAMVTNLNKDISMQMNNPQVAAQISSIVVPQKIATIAYADNLIKKLDSYGKDSLDAGTYFVLASEHLNLANVLLAVAYADRSIAAAGDNKAIEAEAMRLKGRTLFVPSAI